MIIVKRRKGFTLIELLVVVAIIGLLASVVLASLNSARVKGNNAKVKNQLSSIRSAAEIYYSTNNNYGPNTYDGVNSACATPSTIFTDTTSGMKALADVNNYPSGTILDCGSSGTAWSVAATLNGGTGSAGPSWCVDSTGVSRGTLSSGATYVGLNQTGGAHHNPGWPSCD